MAKLVGRIRCTFGPSLGSFDIMPKRPSFGRYLHSMNSIMSYADRGPYGDSKWRGNTSGRPLIDLFGFLRPDYVVDPAEGSGTTGDVCREMGIQYTGLDLHSGFNLLKDNLAQRLHENGSTRKPDMVFFHPPYNNMIVYSGNVWGQAHEDDLSRCSSTEDFIQKMELSMINIYDAVRVGGHYAIMIADHRSKGEFRSYQADLIGLGIGQLKSVIIKAQHNCWSDRQLCSGSFIPIKHEYLILWCKDAKIQSIGALAVDRSQKLSRKFYGTWKNVVEYALRKLGGRGKLGDIYSVISADFTAPTNNNVEAKVRQVLQRHFPKVGIGEYTLAA